MIDANNAQRRTSSSLGEFHRHGRRGENCVDRVDWDRVIWICGVAADVADNAKVSLGDGEGCGVKEGWNWVGEVYAVDEYV
jgi:hypothetical protein